MKQVEHCMPVHYIIIMKLIIYLQWSWSWYRLISQNPGKIWMHCFMNAEEKWNNTHRNSLKDVGPSHVDSIRLWNLFSSSLKSQYSHQYRAISNSKTNFLCVMSSEFRFMFSYIIQQKRSECCFSFNRSQKNKINRA